MNTRSRIKGSPRRAVAALVAGVVVASTATLASAASPPAQHFPLVPVGGEPLQQGFVEVIHPNGPEVYAHHVYLLNGARTNQSYDVVISIWTSSLACADAPTFVLPGAALDTNGSGNGEADAVYAPELLTALGLRDRTIGGVVTLFSEGSQSYTTGCQVIRLD